MLRRDNVHSVRNGTYSHLIGVLWKKRSSVAVSRVLCRVNSGNIKVCGCDWNGWRCSTRINCAETYVYCFNCYESTKVIFSFQHVWREVKLKDCRSRALSPAPSTATIESIVISPGQQYLNEKTGNHNVNQVFGSTATHVLQCTCHTSTSTHSNPPFQRSRGA